MPQVANMSKRIDTTATKHSPAVVATPTATPSPTPAARGDLAGGSLTKVLAAGDRQLVINYWTADNPAAVSATAPMTLQLAAHLEGGTLFTGVKVGRFLARFDDGGRIATVSDDHAGVALTEPFSYSTAMILQPTSKVAGVAKVTVEFDLLIETMPGSGIYFRQTVLDTLTVAFNRAGSSS